MPVKRTKRAPHPACPSGYSYYKTSCSNDIGYIQGCYPCGHHDDRNLSFIQKLGARELTINIIPAAASSSAAATSTQATERTSSALIKTPTAPSSNNLLPSSSITTSSGHISSTTSTTVTQAASPVVAAVSSPVPASPSHSSQSSHSKSVAAAAGAVGAIFGVIIALISIVLVLRWVKRRKEERAPANGPGNDLQSSKGNKAGPGYTQDGSGKSRDFDQIAPLPSNLSQRGASTLYLPDYMIISRP